MICRTIKKIVKSCLALLLFYTVMCVCGGTVNAETTISKTKIKLEANTSGANMIIANFASHVYIKNNDDYVQIFINLIKPETMDKYELSVNNQILKTVKTNLETNLIPGKIYVSVVNKKDLASVFNAKMYIHVMKREVSFNFRFDNLEEVKDGEIFDLINNYHDISLYTYDFYQQEKKLTHHMVSLKSITNSAFNKISVIKRKNILTDEEDLISVNNLNVNLEISSQKEILLTNSLSYQELNTTFDLTPYTNNNFYIVCIFYVKDDIISNYNELKITYDVSPFNTIEVITDEEEINDELNLDKIYQSRRKMKNAIIAVSVVIPIIISTTIFLIVFFVLRKKAKQTKKENQ